MDRSPFRFAIAASVVAVGFCLAAPASAQNLTFYACMKGDKVIPGSIQVGSAPACGGGAVVVSWNQAGPTKVIGGLVNLDGGVLVGSGFTVTRVEAGRYNISFPPGTFTTFPVMTVTPFGVFGAYGNPVVASAIGYANGSAVFQVVMSSTTPQQTLYDNSFFFIVVSS